ncbi:hypothetical protein WOLCODRAFT_64649, partial [Wolfiporia cocos MD-104 SS10]
MTKLPPMGPQMFESALRTQLDNERITLDDNLLQIDGQRVALHKLHCLVIQAGGYTQVSIQNGWPLIAAEMGLKQSSGDDNGPARTGQDVSTQLQSIYRTYLCTLDSRYIAQFLQMLHLARFGTREHAADDSVRSLLCSLLGATDPQAMSAIVEMSDYPAVYLRSHGVPESLIAVVDANRPVLQ